MYHVVESSDTLMTLSELYNTPISLLRVWNLDLFVNNDNNKKENVVLNRFDSRLTEELDNGGELTTDDLRVGVELLVSLETFAKKTTVKDIENGEATSIESLNNVQRISTKRTNGNKNKNEEMYQDDENNQQE